MSHPRHTNARILRDLFFVAVSIIVAIILIRTGSFNILLSSTQDVRFLGSFIAGIFFTSIFTIAPSSVALVEIAETTPVIIVAFFGALGAMLGDLFLFSFIRDTLAEDFTDFIQHTRFKKILLLFKKRMFRWIIPMIGAFIIVSPLPDELGLTMMGFARMSIFVLLPTSFVLNFIGILLITALSNII